MEIGNEGLVKTFGQDTKLLAFSFQTNGTSNPVTTGASSTLRAPPGVLVSVTYGATGVYTIVFDSSIVFPDLPYEIEVSPQAAVLATDWFDCFVVGEFNRSTRTLVVQAHRSGTGQAPANTAGNRINVCMYLRNSTGR